MSLRTVREALDRWTAEGHRAAVATLIAVRRSAPLPPGARFAISATGDLAGSISSGCVEGDLHERLSGILGGAPSETVTYGITDEMASGVGLACGGEIDVLLEEHDPEDPAWQALVAVLDRRIPAVLLTGASAHNRGRHLLLEPDRASGSLGSSTLDAAARERAEELLVRTDARLIDLLPDDGESSVFAESFVAPPRLAIVGATPIGQALCAMAARTGFEVVVIEPRKAFARPERVPDAIQVTERWPDDALGELDLDPRTSIVILTHDEKLDEPALATALSSSCGYVGLLGGRRTQGKRRAAMIERGFDEEACGRIHGPVGLDIGARTPEQIAVSILAQLIALGHAP